MFNLPRTVVVWYMNLRFHYLVWVYGSLRLAPARSGSLRLRIAYFDVLRIFKICFRYGGYLRILIHIQDAMATPWRSMKAYPPVVAEKQQ